jgi:flavin-dependent dehydrogenase
MMGTSKDGHSLDPSLTDSPSSDLDVAICGGGLAGLALARQRQMPDLRIAVIERLEDPLPEAAFKVGESSTEIGSFYLTHVLGLEEHMERDQLAKLGFRFFYSSPTGRFEDRPEFGIVNFPAPFSSYNYDRGILESHLRDVVRAAGIELRTGCRVGRIEVSPSEPHRVAYTDPAGASRELRARWVVDALGRRRLLQSRLRFDRNRSTTCNATWFRVRGRVDVADLVPETATAWHERVPEGRRYYSTNHLTGHGYWVWLIPLSSGHTSVGIVAADEVHPHSGFNRWDRALHWLEQYEPQLAERLSGEEPLDFKSIRRYSRSSRRIFSADRWACVGDAAVFSDPLYATALDIIGFTNCAVTELIRRDREGTLGRRDVAYFNRAIIGINDALTANIQINYQLFGNAVVSASKVAWDTAVAWGQFVPRMFNATFTDPETTAELQAVNPRSFFLTERMQALFLQWGEKSGGRLRFDFVDFLEIPHLRAMRRRNMRTGKSRDELLRDHAANLDALEELAQALFLLAVEDVFPEHLARFQGDVWLNAWAVSLKPGCWEADGLFEPPSKPCLAPMHEGLQAMRRLFGAA